VKVLRTAARKSSRRFDARRSEKLYFHLLGEPVYEPTAPDIAATNVGRGAVGARQLTFKF